MTDTHGEPREVDPFDLPEALGSGEVTWSSVDPLASGHHVRGLLRVAGSTDLDCDLLAVDQAYPAPVASESVRLRVHQAWRHGEVHLASYDERLTLLVPGTSFTADLALEAVARLAKALGAAESAFSVHLRLGRASPTGK
ncbi:MAG: hypothetical protein WB471_00620 [Nocardioides sp.]